MLTQKERELVGEFLGAWVGADCPLAGDASYQDVIDLLAKLGVPSAPLSEHIDAVAALLRERTDRQYVAREERAARRRAKPD